VTTSATIGMRRSTSVTASVPAADTQKMSAAFAPTLHCHGTTTNATATMIG
jgi:hypothetical protein